MKKSNFLQFIAWILLIVSLAVIGFFLYNSSDYYHFWGKGKIDYTVTGQFGDFVGGFVGTLISAAAFIFLYITLKEQRDNFSIERFETKFFDLLRIHRDNVLEIKVPIHKDYSDEGKNVEGKKAIRDIVQQFLDCRNELKIFFNKLKIEDIYEKEYADQLIETLKYTNPKIDLLKLAKINIPYCIIFFGVDAEGKRILERIFRGKYKLKFYQQLIEYISLKPLDKAIYGEKWDKLQKISVYKKRRTIGLGIISRRKTSFNKYEFDEGSRVIIENLFYNNDFIKYYGGNQFRLGHYFRHLFQTVTYVHNESNISTEQKHFYIKTLRAQFSTYEQILFFINSVSFLGMAWELTPKYCFTDSDTRNKKRARKNMLVSNYQLIKNIPNDDIFGFKISDFYPRIILETNISYLKPIKKT